MTPLVVDGLRTFVLDEGMGDPVVFLHGIPTQAYLWRDVAHIVVRQRRVIAPDLLGFGFADKPSGADLSPAAQARFVTGILEQLEIDRFALVAHDYGALVAAELLLNADAQRISRLVLLNTSFWREDWSGSNLSPLALLKLQGVGELALRVARPFMLTQAFRLYVEDDERLSPDTMAVYWHPFQHGFDRTLLALARERHMTEDDFCRWRDAIDAYPNPALVVWGERDPTFGPAIGRRLAGIFTQGHYEGFQHSNHFVPEDRPEALGRLIGVFLGGGLT
jgi:pimeloyl-ACP methyl ester carboxylesterase